MLISSLVTTAHVAKLGKGNYTNAQMLTLFSPSGLTPLGLQLVATSIYSLIIVISLIRRPSSQIIRL